LAKPKSHLLHFLYHHFRNIIPLPNYHSLHEYELLIEF